MKPTAATTIRSGIIIGTHNGTIYNADYLFRRLGLPRYAEVDSELLFRLADRFAPDGTIDGRGFRKALRLCRGQMSAVLASRLDPGPLLSSRETSRCRCVTAANTGRCSTPRNRNISKMLWMTCVAGVNWKYRRSPC